MRKFIFTLMLAIAGSVWTITEAGERWCMPAAHTDTEPWIIVSGVFAEDAYPCEPEQPCQTCLTIVLKTSDKTYYLTAGSSEVDEQLDAAKLGPRVTVEGKPFTRGSYDYIEVNSIDYGSLRLPSLCDEWHLETYTVVDPDNPDYHEYTQRLAADTIIGGKQYRQLRGMREWTPIDQNDNNYLGALREGNNADIYYVPAGSTHEFLLYAFNVQVGDTLTNLWIGNYVSEPYGYKAKVTGVGTGKFKRIDLHVFDTDDNKGVDCWADTHWLDSIGRYTGPVWADPVCYAINPAPEVICACKESRKVYARDAKCACDPLRLKSLCDTWNVLFVRMGANGDELSTEVHRLTTDTVINGKTYVQLYIYGDYGVRDRVTYRGALREDNNANVYIVPANSDHEYLLYAFNAKVGDKLSNLWVGGAAETGGLPDGLNARVTNITESSPRIFTLYLDIDEYHPIQWIEGVGLTDCPGGSICPAVLGCGCSCGHIMLCAYKDGELVYDNPAWDWCYYDSAKQPADTVALYWRSGDGPGSTTVTPVDPNQVVATLNDNLLTIREQSGEEVTYSLAVTPISHAPARHALPEAQKEVSADTFRNSVAVQLSEDGSYTLTLSKAGWENDIYGTFDYTASGLQPIAATDAPARKLLRNGQLLIRQGDKIFTLTGVQVE